MAESPRDQNFVPAALFEIDGSPGSVMPGQIDEVTGRVLVDSTGGGGDVVGPASSTDNAIALFDGTTGKLIQNSSLLVDDSGNIQGPTAGFTITGGTSTTADLTFKTTTNVGASGADMHFLVGNNGATEAMTILNSGNVGIGTSSPYAQLSIGSVASGVTGIALDADSGYSGNLIDLRVASTSIFSVSQAGAITVRNTGASTVAFNWFGSDRSGSLNFNGGNIQLTGGSTGASYQSTRDTSSGGLQRFSAFNGNTVTTYFAIFDDAVSNVMALRNGTNASTFRVYNTSASSNANYERGVLDWQASSSVFRIGTENGGTGSARNLAFVTGSSTRMTLDTSGNLGIGTTSPTTKLQVTNTTDAASVQAAIFEGDRATPAANDTVYSSYNLSSSTGVQREFGRISSIGISVTNAAENGALEFGLITAGTLVNHVHLGTASFRPVTNDSHTLGTGTFSWSDLFLASGGVINWNNGNAVITHSSGVLDVTTGDFQVSNPGTNADSVLTRTGAQTVTSKRNQPRTASSTSNANLNPDLSVANVYYRTTQTTGLTIGAPTGTPVIGETIAIYVDSAGAQTLTINAAFVAFGSAFPASTTAGKTFMLVAQYNGTSWLSTWANAV